MKFATVLSLAAGALAHASVSTDEAASVSLISESAASTSIAAGVTTLVSESSVPSGEPSGEASESITYTTSIVTAITTYCPEATEIVHGSSTYTVTEPTTLTISDCPCTIKVPVTTISSVICNNCPPPSYHNSTSAPAPVVPTTTSIGTVTLPAVPTTETGVPPIATAGAGKAAALSGGALAGVLGLAAFIL